MREKEARPGRRVYGTICFFSMLHFGIDVCVARSKAHIIANFASASPDMNSGRNEYKIIYHDWENFVVQWHASLFDPCAMNH